MTFKCGANVPDEGGVLGCQGTEPTQRVDWAVAAPRLDVDGVNRSTLFGTQSETAANFFDVVFLSVALVAYTPGLSDVAGAPRTTTCRSGASITGGICQEWRDNSFESAISSIVRFPRATSNTAVIAERIWLESLQSSLPERVDCSPHYSTGPPKLPFISIRAWTSYYG
jgi:hypothetical protein